MHLVLLAIQDNPLCWKAFYENVFLPRRAEGCKVVQERSPQVSYQRQLMPISSSIY